MTEEEINKLEIELGGTPHPENEHQKVVAKLCAMARIGLWAKKCAIPALEYYAEEYEGAQRARDALMDQFMNKPYK